MPIGMVEPTGSAEVTATEAPALSETRRLTDPEVWRLPSWFSGPRHHRSVNRYEEFLGHQLRARYIELENDFRSILGNFVGSGIVDAVTARQMFDLLQASRTMLELDQPDLLVVSNALDLIERYMVWITPPHIADARFTTLEHRIEGLPASPRTLYSRDIQRLRAQPSEIGAMRALADEVIGACNRQALAEAIGNGLQLRRLRALRLWGMILLAVFLVGSPLAFSTAGDLATVAYQLPGIKRSLSDAWLTAVGVALIGAVGAFLSGLLQARDSRVDLVQYQSGMLRLQLRPIVGAMVSVVLAVLLSWNILPGIRVDNRGSLFFIAFLAGFSERYFLRLLDLSTDDQTGEPDSRDNSSLVSSKS